MVVSSKINYADLEAKRFIDTVIWVLNLLASYMMQLQNDFLLKTVTSGSFETLLIRNACVTRV